MPRVLVYIAIVSVLTCYAHARNDAALAENQPIGETSRNNASSEMNVYEELFKNSFVLQRKEHMEAINRLQKINNYERLYKMIVILGEKMINVIGTSKELIEGGGFNPDNRSLPQNVTVQSAISTTLENAALFGDILLHFPHIVHRILKTQPKWNPIVAWSLNFTHRAKHLLDSDTLGRVHLASQELNIIERDKEYFNPYWQSVENEKEVNKGKAKKKKWKKNEKQKRKPQMAKIEL